MTVHFMNEDALVFLKGNIQSYLPHYQGDNQWIMEICEENGLTPFSPFKNDVPEIVLSTFNVKPEKSDLINTKILYTALKNLSDSQAADERFWAGLAHFDFWDFMVYRWKLNQNTVEQATIESNFFFMRGKKRSLFRHTLSRMWWVGRLTYDETAEDPFESLEYLKTNFGTKVFSLFSSNFTSNPTITRAILKALLHIEKEHEKVSREDFLELIRYVNMLGGIIILDYLTEEELKEQILSHYLKTHSKGTVTKKETSTRTRRSVSD